MSTITSTLPQERKKGGNGKFLFLILLVITFASISNVVLKDHANKHRYAENVRNCISGNPENIQGIFTNPDTGRSAICVKMPDGKFGIQIVEEIDGTFEEVTSFLKNKMSKLDQVIKYLNNRGYQ